MRSCRRQSYQQITTSTALPLQFATRSRRGPLVTAIQQQLANVIAQLSICVQHVVKLLSQRASKPANDDLDYAPERDDR